MSDRVVTAQEEQELANLQRDYALTRDDIGHLLPAVERAKSLQRVLSGWLPDVRVPLMLRAKECCHFSVPAELMEERVVRREYVGTSQGVSIRIAKGLTYRVGATRGYSVPVHGVVPIDTGTFYITSVRSLFVGSRKNVSVAHGKLLSFQAFADGLQLQPESRSRLQYIRLNDGELAAAVLTVVLARYLG